jgi:phage recombination protein Bet
MLVPSEGATMSQNLPVPVAPSFTDEQVGLIKRQLCVGASDDELALFLGQCRRTGLDPFAKQIYLIKRQGKMTVTVGIDGYRLIADRSGLYAGNDDPVFDSEEKPTRATVTVYKMVKGVRCAFTATARWAQYYPGDAQGFMWKKMPHLMLGKAAEALALRKAFPAELSGVYTDAEMDQAGAPDAEPEPPKQAVTVKQLPPAEAKPSAEDAGRVLLAAASTPDQLGAAWKMLPPKVQAVLQGYKDTRKRELTDAANKAKVAELKAMAKEGPELDADGNPIFAEDAGKLFGNPKKQTGVPH